MKKRNISIKENHGIYNDNSHTSQAKKRICEYDKRAAVLMYFSGTPIEEICKKHEVTPGTVNRWVCQMSFLGELFKESKQIKEKKKSIKTEGKTKGYSSIINYPKTENNNILKYVHEANASEIEVSIESTKIKKKCINF